MADNGTFTLNDWRFTSALAGTFLAFRADGSPIIAHDFAANIYESGLSPDGRLAVCQACNASNSEDSSRLVIFDLEAGVETGSGLVAAVQDVRISDLGQPHEQGRHHDAYSH